MDSAVQNILSRFPGKRILVVGDVMLDEYLWGSVRRISQEAPVPVVDLHKRSFVPGGAANTAANLAGLQAQVYLVGIRGDDETGKRLAHSLSESAIHLDGLLVEKNRPTTSKMRIIAHSQQVVRVDHEERNAIAADVEDQLLKVIAKRMPEVDGCILSDYAKGVMTRKVAQAVIQQANQRGIAVVVDPKGADFAKYRGATLIKPNMQEAALSIRLEEASAEQMVVAGQYLLATLGCAGVLITCGAAGMSLFERVDGEPIQIPAAAREVYDVTGAGDTVASTMVMALTAGASLEQAARLASHAAGIIIGRVGTSAVRLQELTCTSASTPADVNKPASHFVSKEHKGR
jgi:D-beta-D-heptose 7-phosphate kinase/D-beta-D-heptose 1-phosphate adenosyltransferase